MRLFLAGLAFALSAIAPAYAQTSITIAANPVPIVEASINGHPVRLEVHLLLSPSLLLNQSAADRLGVRTHAIGRRILQADGATALRGRAAAPRLTFEGRPARVMTGVFAAPVTTLADGIIGPPGLPYDIVTIALGPEPPGARDIVLQLESDRRWAAQTEVGGHRMRVEFDVSQAHSTINRSASRIFDTEGAIVSDGAPTLAPIILGLSTRVQPVRTELTALGLALNPAVARTDAPLMGEAGAEIVMVESTRPPPPMVILGRSALSRCANIVMNRAAGTLTLRCAP